MGASLPGGMMSNAEAAGLDAAVPPAAGGRQAAGAAASGASMEEGHPARWWIMTVLAAVAFMAQLDLFIVNVALPVIRPSYSGSSLSGLALVPHGFAIT